IIERIQHMFMRVAVTIHLDDIPSVLSTYTLLSSRQIAQDPLMSLYAGTTTQSRTTAYTTSFFNLDLEKLYGAVADCAFAIRNGGRVAISAQNVLCGGRKVPLNIGLWALLKLLDSAISLARRTTDTRQDVANLVIQPWHLDIRSALEYHTMHQHDLCDQKCISLTLSVPDIFMSRVESDGDWSLFCPRQVPDLLTTKGQFFERTYIAYEASHVPRVKIRAREIWSIILRAITVTGGPSIIFKDSVDGKTNVPDLPPGSQHGDLRSGVIDSLGTGLELSPCNHVAISLPLLITRERTFDFDKLYQLTKNVVVILNKVHDSTVASMTEKADLIKDYHPIAIGVQGLADVFTALRMPYDSPAAGALNIRIAETMYFAALDASCDLAEKHGPYPAYSRSPLARGIMQFDMWHQNPSSTHLDWTELRARIQTFGVRNSLLIAIRPQDVCSAFSNCTHPLYRDHWQSTRLTGDSNMHDQVVSPWLVQELIALRLWSDSMRERIISAGGSVQDIEGIPTDVKRIYRTAWEIDPECTIRMAIQRAPYVCHTDSISLHLESPTPNLVGELLMSSWASGLKTGLHKLHAR
ncbi:ribonucleotide reductase large subunit, partial [Mycena rosella]